MLAGARSFDRPATLADLETLPPTWRGEILDDVLYAFPRPRPAHASVESNVVMDVGGAFHKGRGGPGGWWILPEPGICLPNAPEISPDVAGWRRDRLPMLPRKGSLVTVPDWCCEILSPRTRGYDLVIKRQFYAHVGVSYLWYVDPEARVLSATRLVDGKWLELGTFGDNDQVCVEPFEAVQFALGAWWDGLADNDDEE